MKLLHACAHTISSSLEKSVTCVCVCSVPCSCLPGPELYTNNKKRIRCWLVVETTRVTAYGYINGQQTAEPLVRPILLSEDDATRSKQLELLPDEARRCVHTRVCGLAAACLRTRCPSLFTVPPGVGTFRCTCCACTMACTRPHDLNSPRRTRCGELRWCGTSYTGPSAGTHHGPCRLQIPRTCMCTWLTVHV